MNEPIELKFRRGDIVYIKDGDWSTVGSEQNLGRPAVIVSNDIGNTHSPLVEVVFLTTAKKKNLPTHVSIMSTRPSTALCENIQTVSKERLGAIVKHCSAFEMAMIDEALMVSLGIAPMNEQVSYRSLYERLLDKVMIIKCESCRRKCLCRNCPKITECPHALKRRCKAVCYCSIYRRIKEESNNESKSCSSNR